MVGELITAGLAAAPLLASYFSKGKEGLTGSPERVTNVPHMNPMQQQYQQQGLQYAGNQLFGPQNQFDFAPIAAEARKNYQTQTIPSIMQRFASNDMLGSSGLNSALSGSAKDLEMGLASLRSQYNLQRQPLLQDLLRMGLAPQGENILRPEEPGALQNLYSGAMNAAGQIGGQAAGGYFKDPENATKFVEWLKSLFGSQQNAM